MLYARQYGGFHADYFVDVVGKVDVHVNAELVDVEEAVGVEVHFPSVVAHLAHVAVGQRAEARRCWYGSSAHEQVLGSLRVEVDFTRDAVVEETEVETYVPSGFLLPFELAHA